MENEETITQDIQEPVQEETTQPEVEQQDTSKEANFRAIREAKDRAERERDDYSLRNQELQNELQKAQHGASSHVEEETDVSEDELLDGKHYRRMMKEVKDLKNQLSTVHKESSSVAIETRLKQQYPDFDTVVSAKNIKALRDKFPHIAKTLHSDPDLMSQGSSAYTMIKELGIEKIGLYDKDRELANQNHNKPRPLSSISPQQGDGPLSQANAFANGLTDELKTQLRKEMYEAKKYM